MVKKKHTKGYVMKNYLQHIKQKKTLVNIKGDLKN